MILQFRLAALGVAVAAALTSGCGTQAPALKSAQRQQGEPADGRVRLTPACQIQKCVDARTPAPVAPPPAPLPVTVTERVELSADALFVFGKGEVGDIVPAGRERLAQLTRQIAATYTSVESVKITGYTDRLGSEKFNRVLGARRAHSVKTLMESQGLDRRIAAQVHGATDQVVACGTARKATPALIACLQPNRRVVVEVTGVRTK